MAILKAEYEVSKATFKHIEAELYKYNQTVKEIQKLRYNVIQSTEDRDENVGGGRSGRISNPTEEAATRLTTHKQLEYLEDIAYSIETVHNLASEDYRQLIQIRYWSGKEYTWDGLALELKRNKRTVQRWRNEIVGAIAEVLGWR